MPFLISDSYFYITANGDNNGHDNKSDTETRLQDMDTPDSDFPNVPTAVSLIAQDVANEDITNDSDPELPKVLI